MSAHLVWTSTVPAVPSQNETVCSVGRSQITRARHGTGGQEPPHQRAPQTTTQRALNRLDTSEVQAPQAAPGGHDAMVISRSRGMGQRTLCLW